jgi:hypothetical protein
VIVRKILLSASLGSMLLISVPAIAQTGGSQDQSGHQTQAETKSVSGKVTSIGDDRRSFVVEVDKGGAKQNMNFILDKNSQVLGRVTTGTVVVVEYQPNGDQNLVVKVSPQQG